MQGVHTKEIKVSPRTVSTVSPDQNLCRTKDYDFIILPYTSTCRDNLGIEVHSTISSTHSKVGSMMVDGPLEPSLHSQCADCIHFRFLSFCI